MPSRLNQLTAELKAASSPAKAATAAWFFKTGPGQYGEGDIFIGLTVPEQRRIARGYFDLSLKDIDLLLASPIHEHRLVALIILGRQFKKGTELDRRAIFDFYMAHTMRVNNWDLVDESAPAIVGGFLLDRDKGILDRLDASDNLWERRIAIVATYAFIKRGELEDTFRIAELLLADRQDLIHKAAGWMLREAGKRDQAALKRFLDRHYLIMPRTMLRYSIEKFDPATRAHYMAKPPTKSV